MGRAGGDDERVVLDFSVAEYDSPFRSVDVNRLSKQHLRVFLPPQNLAQRRGDVGRRERSRRHLIQQRLKKMVIAAINQRDVYRGVLQGLGEAEAAEPSPDYDNSVTI